MKMFNKFKVLLDNVGKDRKFGVARCGLKEKNRQTERQRQRSDSDREKDKMSTVNSSLFLSRNQFCFSGEFLDLCLYTSFPA